MLLHLIAFGFIAAGGAVVDPETGDASALAGRTAVAKANTAVSGVGVGVPTTASVWTQPLDPSDKAKYAMDWSEMLGTAKITDIISLTMSAAGAAVGVQIDIDTGRQPIIDTAGKAIAIYLKVDDAFKSNTAFANPGLKVGIAALIRTDSDPFEEFERTWQLTVTQQ